MNKILYYLSELENNNNREWYLSHKEDLIIANLEFEAIVFELIEKIGLFDDSILFNDPKKLTFKLIRDTRFSADKSPYNPCFRANIGPKGKLFIPVGYFLQIKPNDRSFLGGGMFASMFKDATKMIRDYITVYGEEFQRIIDDKEFSTYYKILGDSLKKVPNGYDALHPQAEYLKNKSWYTEFAISDKVFINRQEFIETAAQQFKIMKPFNDFLNRALINFKLPIRQK
jgi:uncharacterized protein (TIGR02453 family)